MKAGLPARLASQRLAPSSKQAKRQGLSLETASFGAMQGANSLVWGASQDTSGLCNAGWVACQLPQPNS